ncbi:transposase [Polyangium sp. y55x31]|uniref:transposase n=1 Tax=Polyangium sp. y55x31 TaxID=3042688 RepID=UPI0024822DF0|nr:transposase [Polyangium sp. y55x31]MDI1484337.1 transposase [Polyangium sp. y55x31]
MSMGRRREKQAPLWVAAPSLPRSPGHRFYEKLNELLRENGFDRAMEAACAKYFEADGTAGRPSIPPGLYFRMLLVGFFEGIESERGLEWRCSDSLSLREFLGLLPGETVPDHSTLSKMRKRLGSEVFEAMFAFVLGVVHRSGLLQGKVMGVDSTYLRADASMKAIVRRETGEVYADFIKRLAKEEGIENPTVEDARRLDRKRKGKKTSNTDWKSPTDEEARITKLKDGRTRLAYKTEHVVDMSSGVVVAAEVYSADQADPATMAQSLEQARTNVEQAKSDKDRDSDDDSPPEGGSSDAQPERTVIEVVADKGYHKAELLLSLKESGYRTYVPERSQPVRKWVDKGWDMQQAFYGNRYRVRRPKGRALQRKRGEFIERTFAHACETGGMRRVRVRGRENVRKRYLAHVAALNLGLVLRQILGSGTPRGLAAARKGFALAILVIWAAMVALVRRMPRQLARFSRAAWDGMQPGHGRDVGIAIGVA